MSQQCDTRQRDTRINKLSVSVAMSVAMSVIKSSAVFVTVSTVVSTVVSAVVSAVCYSSMTYASRGSITNVSSLRR